jgi:hypothetical protein
MILRRRLLVDKDRQSSVTTDEQERTRARNIYVSSVAMVGVRRCDLHRTNTRMGSLVNAH